MPPIMHQVETLSCGIPLLVARLGDRRRLERSWMGWRAWLADRCVARADAQLECHEQVKEELERTQSLLQEALLRQEQLAAQQLVMESQMQQLQDGDGKELLADNVQDGLNGGDGFTGGRNSDAGWEPSRRTTAK